MLLPNEPHFGSDVVEQLGWLHFETIEAKEREDATAFVIVLHVNQSASDECCRL